MAMKNTVIGLNLKRGGNMRRVAVAVLAISTVTQASYAADLGYAPAPVVPAPPVEYETRTEQYLVTTGYPPPVVRAYSMAGRPTEITYNVFPVVEVERVVTVAKVREPAVVVEDLPRSKPRRYRQSRVLRSRG